MIILGIETSCDETALCLLEINSLGKYRVLEHLISSQANLHAAFGGVFPALAKREHAKNLVPMLETLMFSPRLAHQDVASIIKRSRLTINESRRATAIEHLKSQEPDLLAHIDKSILITEKIHIDLVAVTAGPGLEPALWVGVNFAKAISKLWNIPLTSVNHMEGHILGSLIEHDEPSADFHNLRALPKKSLALLISGGHTELVEVTNDISEQSGQSAVYNPKYKILGTTRDDALGEAYDKIARMLGLPYPGGPHLANLAEEYRLSLADKVSNPNMSSAPVFPRPMIHSKDYDFSFAGLKTAVLYHLRSANNIAPYTPKKMRHDVFEVDNNIRCSTAYAFEEAITEILVTKTRKALEATSSEALIVGGGVIANQHIRRVLTKLAQEFSIPLYLPAKSVSGDNALMIAFAGALYDKQLTDSVGEFGIKRDEHSKITARGNIRVDEQF